MKARGLIVTSRPAGASMVHDQQRNREFRRDRMLVDRLYSWLGQGAAPDVDRIFIAALERSEPLWGERIVKVLLARNQEHAWAGVISRYAALPGATRQELRAEPERFRAACAIAMRSANVDTRMNAAHALLDACSVRLSYLLPDALRDDSPKVRRIAARVLRRTADAFLRRGRPKPEAPDEIHRDYGEMRQDLVRSIRDAMRTFDLHFHPEVLETALWFARDLDEPLWELLGSHRSRAGRIVAEHLETWNHPRLAPFLLGAIRRSGWRTNAAHILRGWSDRAQVSALLRQQAVLADEATRDALRTVDNPRWFSKFDAELSDLPPALRTIAPHWVRYAGFGDDRRLRLLSRWARARDEHLARGAVYALASIDDTSAVDTLQMIAAYSSPLGYFARWYVRGHSTAIVRRARSVAKRVERERDKQGSGDAETAILGVDAAAAERHTFTTLWEICRDAASGTRRALLEVMRGHAHIWSEPIAEMLMDDDPHARLLAMQLVSTAELAPPFRSHLEALCDDATPSVRKVAENLVARLRDLPDHAWRVSEPSLTGAAAERIAADLHEHIEQLGAQQTSVMDPLVAEQLDGMLDRIYGRIEPASPAEPAPPSVQAGAAPSTAVAPAHGASGPTGDFDESLDVAATPLHDEDADHWDAAE